MQKTKTKDYVLLGTTTVCMFAIPISAYLSTVFDSIAPDLAFFIAAGWLMSFWWSNSGLRRKDRRR